MTDNRAFYWTLIGALSMGVLAAIASYLFIDRPLVWQGLWGLTAGLAVTHLVINLNFYKRLFAKRTTQLGLRTVLNAILVLLIVVVINLIVNNYDVKKDITVNRIHTLSEQSLKVLRNLPAEVTLKAFLKPTQTQDFENIFSKYTYESKKVKREFIDVDREPLLARRYNVKALGTVVVESGDRNVRVENLTGPEDPKLEEKLTNAIISVIKGGKKKLYYISGHGERLLTDTSREGFSDMKTALENGRYQVEELVLLEQGKIPADAELVLMAGPKSELMPQEYQALESYLRSGGKMLLMVEPFSPPSLRGFLLKFGADWKPKKAIVETNRLQQRAGGNLLTPIVKTYDANHEITRDANQLTLFPVCTPVEKAKDIPEGEVVTSLLSTSSESLETEFQGDKVKVNQATDRRGPLSLAVAISGSVKDANQKTDEATKSKEFRLVVIGDSDFASNSARQFGMNSDFFQNTMSWLAQEEDLIAIRPRNTAESKFDITEQRSRVINLASIIIAPLAMFVSGIVVWISRRRR